MHPWILLAAVEFDVFIFIRLYLRFDCLLECLIGFGLVHKITVSADLHVRDFQLLTRTNHKRCHLVLNLKVQGDATKIKGAFSLHHELHVHDLNYQD